MEIARKKEPRSLSRFAAKAAIIFFAGMAVLTVVSSVASSALTAKVTTGTPHPGTLDKSVSGTGLWTADGDSRSRTGFAGLRVDKVFVKTGDCVKSGDALYSFDKSSVDEAIANLDDAITRFELQIKELKAGRSDLSTGAKRTLSVARETLARAESELQFALLNLPQKKKQAYDEALNAYSVQARVAELEVQEAQRAVDEAQLTDPYGEAYRLAALELDKTVAQWEVTLSEPRRKLNEAQAEYIAAQNGSFDASSELAAYYTAVDAAEKAVEDAEFALSQAKDTDGDSNTRVGCQAEDVEMSMNAKIAERETLSALSAANFTVFCAADGVVTGVGVSAGALVTGEETVSLSTDGLSFEILIDAEDAKRVGAGDIVTLVQDNENGFNKPPTLTVETVGAPNSEGNVKLVCSGGAEVKDAVLGGKADYSIRKVSDKFDCCVPLSALRQDGAGKYFVLKIGTEETVLGEKEIAVAVPVELIDRDDTTAAVRGELSTADSVITSSQKRVTGGDRVEVDK